MTRPPIARWRTRLSFLSWRRLRLRIKLALLLVVAALLPLTAASTVGVRIALGGLEAGVQQGTARSLRVGLNLVLAHVRALFETAVRIGEAPRLAAGVLSDPEHVGDLLAREPLDISLGLLEVADATGKVVARRAAGSRIAGLALADGAEPIRRALAYERRVSLEASEGRIVARAAAPLLDEQFQLRGAIVLTVPLDAEFADALKAELAADVVIYAGETPVASSFIAPDGRRRSGFLVPAEAAAALGTGRTAIVETAAYDRTFSAGYAPLLDLEGRKLGLFAVAIDSDQLALAKRRAWQSIVVGGLGAFLLALLLAGVAARTLTRPLAHLHESALAVARGELDTRIERETGDEIGDVAQAFAQMTGALRQHQERLAARMRELLTLQEIGRAVSSVLGLDAVLLRIVEQLSAVLEADRAALLFTNDAGSLQVGAAVGLEDSFPLRQLCQLLYWWDGPLLVEDMAHVPELVDAARDVGLRGSLLAVPLEQKDDILGLMLVNRENKPLSDPDLRLVATFADHAATAIQNARLYEAVQRASEGLERKVADRTAELTMANRELERLVSELGTAQSQLVLSERMAGLGFLVAGIAHEINSPAGAIQGAIDSLDQNLEQLVARARQFAHLQLTPEEQGDYFHLIERLTPALAETRLVAPAQLRRDARALAAWVRGEGVADADAHCRVLVELMAEEAPHVMASLLPLARRHGLEPLVGYLEEYAYLYRNVHAIRLAVGRVTRIIGALKGYSHLDQAKTAPADIHEGIENTLIILHHELTRDIVVRRRFSNLPNIPVYGDELNQVWTNLIHNAVQALAGAGEIVVETRLAGDLVEVVVQDDGPGIATEIQGRIYEPFFTTKRPGEGTGLGLGIVRQIVDKHGGRISFTSRPGCTRFSVQLPVAGPPSVSRATSAAAGWAAHG